MFPKIFKLFVIIGLLVFIQVLTNCSHSPQIENCYPHINSDSIYIEYSKKGVLAAVDYKHKLAPIWVQSDLLVLQQAMEEACPSIYRYSNKTEMDSLFESKMCLFQDSVDYLIFIRSIAQIFKQMACIHSNWSHPSSYFPYRNENMTFFPLDIYAIGDQYFVSRNASQLSSISVGDEILILNGQSPTTINSELGKYMIKDGQSAPEGKSGIQRFFRMAYSNFVANPDTFNVTLKKSFDNTEYSLKIPAQPRHVIDSIIKSNYPPKENLGIPLELKIDSLNSIATYIIKWFRNEYIQAHRQDFISFTDSVFQEVDRQNIQNLIIDLRGNVGGWTENGKHLFSYFIEDTMPFINRVEFNTIDTFSFGSLLLRNQGISDTMEFSKNKSGYYEWVNYPSLTVQPMTPGFNGKTFILTDDMSCSCSALFSSMMKSHTQAIFVGSETGGAQCGSNGMIIQLQLPYTGVLVNLSTAKYTANVSDIENSFGVAPDYKVENSLLDLSNSKDPQMQMVYELIQSGKF